MSEIIQNPVINQTPNSSTPHVYYFADGMAIFGCLGSPEGVIAADPGSIALDNQSIPAVAYLKETGSGNTGWQPFQSGSSGITGSGAIPQNTFWTGPSTVSGSNSWTFDNITKQVVLSDNSNLPQLTISRTTATDPSKIYAGVPSYLELRAFDAGDGGTGKLNLVGGASGPGFPLSGNVSAQILFGSTNDPTLAGIVLGGSIKCIATENIGLANGGHGFTWSTTPNGSAIDTSVININKYGILQLGANGTQPSAELSGSGQPFTVVIGNLSTYNTDTAVQIANPSTAPTTEKTLIVQANPNQTATLFGTQSSGGGDQFQIRVIPGVTQHFLSLFGTGTPPATGVAGQLRLYVDASGILQVSEGGGAYSSLVKSSGGTISGALTITSNSANALAVGPNGTTNPVLKVDASVASQATGLSIIGNAAGSGLNLTLLSSGSNENIIVKAKGSGVLLIEGQSAGNTVLRVTDNVNGTFRFGFPSSGVAAWSVNASQELSFGARDTDTGSYTARIGITSSSITIADTINLVLSNTTGSKIATSTSQKLGFWNATPVIQPASANQAALTDSTGGTPGTTINDVGAVYSQSTLNNNFASIVRLLNQLRNDLTTIGIIKGAA